MWRTQFWSRPGPHEWCLIYCSSVFRGLDFKGLNTPSTPPVQILNPALRATPLTTFHMLIAHTVRGLHSVQCPWCRAVFLNRRAAARYRALASIGPGRERFSWNLSFNFLSNFHEQMFYSGNILRRKIFVNVSKNSDPDVGLRKLQYATRFH